MRRALLFATAIYTGMRRGELLGLRKMDVDLSTGLITVSRSHARDTTKSGKAAALPIADELLPYVKAAIERSPSEFVFPGEDGSRMSANNPLEEVLRRALGRAGIVRHCEHACRKKGCGHAVIAQDAAVRRCPKHGHLMWPKAKVRPIRFHDLRHTTASLLMMAGANPAAVQRILRHTDPRITMEVYGHLAPGLPARRDQPAALRAEGPRRRAARGRPYPGAGSGFRAGYFHFTATGPDSPF